MTFTDKEVQKLLSNNNDLAIKIIFDQYYAYMCHAVYSIVNNRVVVEDIVQEVFYELWRKRESIQISISLKAYLRKMCINTALNHIRSQKIFLEEDKIIEGDGNIDIDSQVNMELHELQDQINKSIGELPPKCKIIFSLSRFEDMSYSEISKELDISIKTVENQISRALKLLRTSIYPYIKNYRGQ